MTEALQQAHPRNRAGWPWQALRGTLQGGYRVAKLQGRNGSTAFVTVLVVLATVCAAGPTSAAGLHLGMKLACQRYGEAWNAGDRAGLQAASTPALAAQLDRIPPEVLSSLPKGGAANVVSTRRGDRAGQVNLATSQGPLTMHVVGNGFDWLVDDVTRRGDNGQAVSLREYLDASLTAREFIIDLKLHGGTRHYDSCSRRFRAAFDRLSSDELDRVRQFLPHPTTTRPRVTISGRHATVQVHLPDGKRVTFRLVDERGWKVDDYIIQSALVEIPSFREALPAIASLAGIREFLASQGEFGDPHEFTVPGELQDSLLSVIGERPFPIPATQGQTMLTITRCGTSARLRTGDRELNFAFAADGATRRIERLEVLMGERWFDLGGLLAMRRKAKQQAIAFAGGWTRMFAADANSASDPAPLDRKEADAPAEPAPEKGPSLAGSWSSAFAQLRSNLAEPAEPRHVHFPKGLAEEMPDPVREPELRSEPGSFRTALATEVEEQDGHETSDGLGGVAGEQGEATLQAARRPVVAAPLAPAYRIVVTPTRHVPCRRICVPVRPCPTLHHRVIVRPRCR